MVFLLPFREKNVYLNKIVNYMVEKKIMVFVLMFAILVVVHYILGVVKAFRLGNTKERTWKDSIILGVSLSYILTIIFTGFSL